MTSGHCLSGWRGSSSKVPNPWIALAARPDLTLVRAAISEPGRYYDGERSIVVRKGLLISEERRHLWHEIVHADRRDRFGHSSPGVEVYVERAAVKLAIPFRSLQWGCYQTETIHGLSEILKLPREWVEFRWRIATSWERRTVRERDPLYGEA
jgi:hypothetical protein